MNMTVEELYHKLEDRSFQDTTTGTMFYNVYIFQYPAQEEYEIRKQITDIKSRLRRPSNNLDILTLNIFEEFCTFLDNKSFGKYPSMLQYLLDKEQKDAAAVQKTLIRNACSQEFFKYIDTRISEYKLLENNLHKAYVFMYGFGQLYPYLRTNTFLSNFEQYNTGESYKMIVFYPGHAEGNSFRLFNLLKDDNTYRSIKLINE